MAKVGKHMITVKGVLTPLEVYYTQKEGFSYKGLPEEFVSMMHWSELRFHSEDTMKNTLNQKLQEYHEAIKKQRKVIVISFEGSADLIMNSTGRGSWSGTKQGVSKYFQSITNAPDFCFGFEYKVFYEINGESIAYHNILPNGGVGMQHRMAISQKLVIDWTPEREQFLIDLGGKVQQLIYAVSAFFDNPEALQLMDSHGIKALGMKSNE
jgi:hypothetical protein